MNLSRISDGKIKSVRTHLQMIKDGKLKALYIIFNKPFHLPVGDNRDVDFVKIEYNNGKFIYSYMSVNNDESSWQQGKLIASVEYDTINNVVAQLKMDKTEGNGFEISFNAKDSVNLKQNNMKRIKDSTIPDEWFMNGKAPLLNEPDSQNDTLWKVVLWSGTGYAADPYLFYAPKDFSEQILEVLVAALDKNGITDYYEDDYYWNNPEIDEELEQSNREDVYDLMDAYNDIYIDGTIEGANEPHVLHGADLKIEPADKPIEYYTGETISDSRRVKDSADDEFEFAVAIEDSESMSNAEERKYTKELSQLLSGMQYGDGDEYCETDWVEPMDWTEGDSVAVWGRCYADSPESVEEAIEQCTRDWADNNGFDLRVTVQDAID